MLDIYFFLVFKGCHDVECDEMMTPLGIF
jgi:hypothetical protein